jgi:hypothetical protein
MSGIENNYIVISQRNKLFSLFPHLKITDFRATVLNYIDLTFNQIPHIFNTLLPEIIAIYESVFAAGSSIPILKE